MLHHTQSVRKSVIGVKTISGQDLIKYLTEQMTTYMDLDQDDRRKQRLTRQEIRSSTSKLDRWLGILPLMLKMHLKR